MKAVWLEFHQVSILWHKIHKILIIYLTENIKYMTIDIVKFHKLPLSQYPKIRNKNISIST